MKSKENRVMFLGKANPLIRGLSLESSPRLLSKFKMIMSIIKGFNKGECLTTQGLRALTVPFMLLRI